MMVGERERCFVFSAPPGYGHPQPMDNAPLGMTRSGNPMLSQQQQQQPQPVPNRYQLNSYYSQPGAMPYSPQPQMPSAPHRSLSQNAASPYPGTPTMMPSNGAVNKPNLMDSTELKSDDPFEDPSKLQMPQSQQQQQMFHPLLQTRSRPPAAPYYSNMPTTNNSYYAAQRPMAPSADYNISVGRGMRLPSAPTTAYGTLPVQQRGYMPSSTNDLSAGMNNNNSLGLQSTPPPSVTPH